MRYIKLTDIYLKINCFWTNFIERLLSFQNKFIFWRHVYHAYHIKLFPAALLSIKKRRQYYCLFILYFILCWIIFCCPDLVSVDMIYCHAVLLVSLLAMCGDCWVPVSVSAGLLVSVVSSRSPWKKQKPTEKINRGHQLYSVSKWNSTHSFLIC